MGAKLPLIPLQTMLHSQCVWPASVPNFTCLAPMVHWISPLNGKLNRGFMQPPFYAVTLKEITEAEVAYSSQLFTDNLCINLGPQMKFPPLPLHRKSSCVHSVITPTVGNLGNHEVGTTFNAIPFISAFVKNRKGSRHVS
jgi:hypothetical protein